MALITLTTGSWLHAQELSCNEVLVKARESFDAGHLYGIPSTLKPCIDNGFDKSQKIQAYYLLARTYLLIDDPISAEDSYLKLLKLDPEYKINEDIDPVDIVYLSNKFTTTPIFVLFAKAGFNFSTANPIQNSGTDNTSTSNEIYKSELGFQVGAGGELNISDNLSLGLELDFIRNSYSYTNTFFNNDRQSFEENLTVLSVPVYLKYRTRVNKFMPFIYVGIANDLILTSNASVELIDRVGASNSVEDVAEFSVTGPDVNMGEMRKAYNTSVLAGIGSNYRVGYNYFFIDIRYTLGLSNFVDQDNQYSNEELLYKYAYVDDYKKLNHLSISFGIVKPLYKPRKKTKKVKGFIKNIFK
ncbi:MAG: porin family protein [Fulvivirga sp.]